MAIRVIVACSNDKVNVGVTVEVGNVDAIWIAGIERPVDVDFQAIQLCKCEKNVGPVRSLKTKYD